MLLLILLLLLVVLALAEAVVEVEVLLMVLLVALGSGCFVRPRCRRESNPTHRPNAVRHQTNKWAACAA